MNPTIISQESPPWTKFTIQLLNKSNRIFLDCPLSRKIVPKQCTGFVWGISLFPGGQYIPYPGKIGETHLQSSFWDIPGISHFSKNRNILQNGNFMGYPWDIPYPKKTENFYVPEIFWDIPYSKKTDNFYVPEIFWDIPGISHIP